MHRTTQMGALRIWFLPLRSAAKPVAAHPAGRSFVKLRLLDTPWQSWLVRLPLRNCWPRAAPNAPRPVQRGGRLRLAEPPRHAHALGGDDGVPVQRQRAAVLEADGVAGVRVLRAQRALGLARRDRWRVHGGGRVALERALAGGRGARAAAARGGAGILREGRAQLKRERRIPSALALAPGASGMSYTGLHLTRAW